MAEHPWLHKTLGYELEQRVQRYQLEKEQHLGLEPREQQQMGYPQKYHQPG
ncbi:hypothetical protein NC652_003410 [Populus alba x Populus x berolinensis]|nr:hypothetical protein NC652_003410 [Populus alba x Populus x berolinensis]